MVEQRSEEPRVVSSILSLGTKKPSRKRWFFNYLSQPFFHKLHNLGIDNDIATAEGLA